MSSRMVRYFTVVTGKTIEIDKIIKNELHKEIPCLKEVHTEEESDVILLFCPVVSRVDNDVKAAMQSLCYISDIKTVLLLVLHHTFDPESSVSDSSILITREYTITVDILFHEDKKLFKCLKNKESLMKITTWLDFKVKESPEEEIKRLKHDFIWLKREYTNKEKDALLLYTKEQEKTLKDINTKLEKLTTHQEDHNANHAKDNKEFKDILQDIKDNMQKSPGQRKRARSMEGFPPIMSGESFDPESPAPASELRLVLLGRTGCGKSAVGNIILGGKERYQAGASTVRQQSESREVEVAGRKVTVVETPDWFSPGLSLEELRQDVEHCVRLSAPGPHAFLLVLPVNQSTGEERGILENMEKIFGEKCWRNSIVLFTITDEQQKQNLEAMVQSEDQEVQRLVEKCQDRIHCLNINKSGDGSQVSELLEKIENMVNETKEKFYSSEIYLETASQIKAMERRIKMEREEKKLQEEKELKEKLDSEVQASLRKIEDVIQEHEGDIKQLNARITEMEERLKEENDEEEKRKTESKLKRKVEQKMEMEEKIRTLTESRDREKMEMEKRHRQEMEEIREMYEGEARMEAERNLMKIILPELQRNILASKLKMQEEFSTQIEEKDRELEMLKQRVLELTQIISLQNEVQQEALSQENTGTVAERHTGLFMRWFRWLFRR